MQVKRVRLKNFRNYRQAEIELGPGKTILIGENAQGKSNFLEAVEVCSLGKSGRTTTDSDLILKGSQSAEIEIAFERSGFAESVALKFAFAEGKGTLQKKVQVNGVSQDSIKALLARLVTVSFKAQDLNLLRAGPSARRDWLDEIILRIRPVFLNQLASYQKTVSQRNRLLKTIFEKGKVTVSDQDQLYAWDKQMALLGAKIVKERLKVLSEIMPYAEDYQRHFSKQNESLEAQYVFQAARSSSSSEYFEEDGEGKEGEAFSARELLESEEGEIAAYLVKVLKQKRAEEIGRRQSLVGPHRDDIIFNLNQAKAQAFASQGQQRSLVLSLKLAELSLVGKALDEPPVLLLDDVLAELDLNRQGLLMSALSGPLQTIITTTHLSKFEPAWLDGASVLCVHKGQIEPAESLL